MTDKLTDATAALTVTAATTPATGVTTRSQQKKTDEEREAEDDNDATSRKITKPKDSFKGKIAKLSGSVFQLSEEGSKHSQFVESLSAIKKFMYLEYDHTDDLSPLFNTPCTEATLTAPDDEPPFGADKTTRVTRDHRLYLEWKDECTEYRTRVAAMKSNRIKLFNTILLQCSEAVEHKLEATVGYEAAVIAHDCLWLIQALKNACHHFEHTEYRFMALHHAKKAIYHLAQGPTQSTAEYYKLFQAQVSIIESYGGQIHDTESAAPPAAVISSLASADIRNAYMRDHGHAVTFLDGADPARFGPLTTSLSNSFGLGHDDYPATLSEAYQMLLRYKDPNSPTTSKNSRPPRHHRRHDGRGGDGRGDSGRPEKGRLGNRSGGRSAKTFVQVGFSLTQIDDHFPDGIPSNYVLLDSDSTVSIFSNPALLSDIHEVDEPLFLETNGGGQQISTQMGTVANFGTVWYNPDSIANILSLAQVRRARRVTMDSAVQAEFHVHTSDGTGYTVFSEHPSGLYLHDVSTGIHRPTTVDKPTSPVVIGYSYLQTVAANKTAFTKRQIESADKARALYRMMGRPGPARFIEALKHNHIINCPVTVDDALRAERIYGKDVAYLKGKSTASSSNDHVPDQPPVSLPSELLSDNTNVVLCVDLFYILGLPFYLSTSRRIHYLSCRPVTARTKPVLTRAIQSDLDLYRNRGFLPTEVHADGEFNAFQHLFPGIRFSICAVEDHVPEVERAIRTVKETIRATIHGLPYHRLPRVLVQELVLMAVRTINMLPHADGISTTLSPTTIVTGLPKPDYNTMPLEFGAYVQVYDGTSNDTKSRTMGAIATNPTGNSSGDHYFMSIETGRRIHRRSWTVLPISDAVISLVEALAFQEDMPLVDHDTMIHEYDPDDIADESLYDRTFLPSSDHESDHNLTTDAYTDSDTSDGSDDSDDDSDNGHHDDYDLAPVVPPAPVLNNQARTIHALLPDNEERTNPAAPAALPSDKEERQEHANLAPPSALLPKKEERAPATDVARQPTVTFSAATPDPSSVPVAPRPTSLRPKKPTSYNYRFGFTQIAHSINAVPPSSPPAPSAHPDFASNLYHIQKAITGLLFTQMSAHKGIKKHGQAAFDALRKEFEQFKAMDVLEPLDAFTLTDEQKAESLRSISVVKEKRDGTLKGRTCADGSTQRGKFNKSETGSPTVASDAFFLTALVDALERRDVATADIVGAYLHARMKEFISLRLTGWSVDLMCEVNPSYKPFVVHEGSVKVLYVRANKAIYGCVVSGMLWYELFSTTLESQGFTINPYDFCVANATIDNTQCTIVWYVDDTKISHVKPTVVDSVISMLESHFGTMTVTRGRQHNFLGMHLDFLDDGTVTVHMPSYITSAIEESGLRITRTMPTPCANSLLAIDAESPPLPPSRARTFHSVVAKLIYVGTRARTDILLALGFLCSRVSAPTVQDEKKLQRLLEYLHGTIDLKLRLGADSLTDFTTWVDASFAVHPDMRSHTGGVLSFGRGGLICKSKKQKLNTKSSTEAELIGASDYLPNTLYVKMFMTAQGYPTNNAIFHQDNESAIKMESNGKASCGQRSRHIDIRYFFIADHVRRHDINIVHCPTADMLADFFTKPLQGSHFRRYRSVLLGETHISSLYGFLPKSGIEERVESGNPGDDVTSDVTSQTGTCYRSTSIVDGSLSTLTETAHSISADPEE